MLKQNIYYDLAYAFSFVEVDSAFDTFQLYVIKGVH